MAAGPFPSGATLDTFVTAGALSASWASPSGADANTITKITTGNAGEASAGLATATWQTQFNADMDAWATISVLPVAGDQVTVRVRSSNAGVNNATLSMYFLQVTPSTSTWDIRKKISGAASVSILSVTSSTPVAGDGIGLRCFGNQLSAYIRHSGVWTQISTVADTSIVGVGYTGFTVTDTTARFSAFGGGNVVVIPQRTMTGVGN